MNTIYLCPMLPEGCCSWEGNATDIQAHFEKRHKEHLIESNTMKIKLTQGIIQQNKLMLNYKDTYLVQTKHDSDENKIRVYLRYLGTALKASKIKYFLEIVVKNYGFTSKDTYASYTPVRVENGGIVIDIDTIQVTCGKFDAITCYINFENSERNRSLRRGSSFDVNIGPVTRKSSFQKTLDQICPNDAYFNELHEDYQTRTIDRLEERKLSHDMLVDYMILEEIGETSTDVEVSSKTGDIFITEDVHTVDGAIENFNKVIQCANCSMFMTLPIYMCVSGHSVCFLCHAGTCKICNQSITDVRNFDVEELSKMINRPCRFAKSGCKDMFLGKLIREHEVICSHSTYICPICKWMGKFFEIEKHFKIFHFSVKILATLENPFPLDTINLIINKFGIFFIRSALVSDNTMEWYVVFCGLLDNLSYMKCEVKVKGKRNYENRYFLEQNNAEFRLCISLKQFKVFGVKDKKTILNIECIPK